MKNLILIITMLFSFSLMSYGQNENSEQIVVDVSDLTPDQLEKIKNKKNIESINNRIETYGKWAGVGKEVGVAVREGVTAVKDVSLEFADTNVGTITIGIIVWKVIGKDLMSFIICIPTWIIISFFILKSYFKTCVVHKKTIKNPGLFKYPKEYELIPAQYDDGFGAIIHFMILAISTLCLFAVMLS